MVRAGCVYRKKAKPDFLKTIMKKNQKKVAGVHEAQQELEAAVADDSEEEQDDLPATASQEVLENNCRQIEEKAAALDGGSGIQAPPSRERVLLPAKVGTPSCAQGTKQAFPTCLLSGVSLCCCS